MTRLNVSIKSHLMTSVSIHPLWWNGMLFPPKAKDEIIVS